MGFNAAPKVLDQALDDMDPDATGEISKVLSAVVALKCSMARPLTAWLLPMES